MLSFISAALPLCASQATAEPAGWLQIATQNAGLLSLPSGWGVVSKDEPAELSVISGKMLHVQQALYARSAEPPSDEAALKEAALKKAALNEATLQIFSIWNTGPDGSVLPLSVGPSSTGDIVAGLIGSRFGNVTKLSEDVVETELENVAAITYDVRLADSGGGNLRYKQASLFCGEKRVLVLLHYMPEYEDYWHSQLETLISAWVTHLILTPGPAPEMPAASIPLPAAPALPKTLPQTPSNPPALSPEAEPEADAPGAPPQTPLSQKGPLRLPSASLAGRYMEEPSPLGIAFNQRFPAQPEPAAGQKETSQQMSEPAYADSLIFYAGTGLFAFALLFACAKRILGARRQARQDRPAEPSAKPARRFTEPRAALPEPSETRSVQATLDDTLDDLEAAFGSSYVIEKMKDEIFKAIEMGKVKTKDVPSEGVVLKLCCGALSAMLRTGRYHIGRGILSSEGQDIVNLFDHINGIRLAKACCSPQEAAKDASFIQFCARGQGV